MRPPSEKNRPQIEFLLQRVSRISSLTTGGSFTLAEGETIEAAAEITAGLLEFHPDVAESELAAMVQNAIVEAGRAGALDLGSVLRRMEALERDYLRLPLRRFVLLSSISVRYQRALTRMRLGDATISFHWGVPAKYQLPDTFLTEERQRRHPPLGYTVVTTSVETRSEEAAGQLAFDRLDLVRARWNLILNVGRVTRQFGGWRPRSAIAPGPYHTLHLPSGEPTPHGDWWHDPTIKDVVSPKDVSAFYPALRRADRTIRRSVEGSPLRSLIQTALIRYVRALDETNPSGCFLRLWVTLETLTRPPQGNTETVARRAAKVWREAEYHQIALGHLSRWRNRMVHEGHESTQTRDLVHRLQSYVEVLLQLLIDHPRAFRNIEEYLYFLDLPAREESLARRAQIQRWALNVRQRAARRAQERQERAEQLPSVETAVADTSPA